MSSAADAAMWATDDEHHVVGRIVRLYQGVASRGATSLTALDEPAAVAAEELLGLLATTGRRRELLEAARVLLLEAGYHPDYVAPFVALVRVEADL